MQKMRANSCTHTLNRMEMFISPAYVLYLYINIYWLFPLSFYCLFACLFFSSSPFIGCLPIFNCDFNTHHKYITIIIRLTGILFFNFAQPFSRSVMENIFHLNITFMFELALNFFFYTSLESVWMSKGEGIKYSTY